MPDSGDDLVRDVLDAMKRGAGGDPDALDSLRKHSSKEGNAEEKAPAPPENAHTVTEKEVLRPNGERYYVRKIEIGRASCRERV